MLKKIWPLATGPLWSAEGVESRDHRIVWYTRCSDPQPRAKVDTSAAAGVLERRNHRRLQRCVQRRSTERPNRRRSIARIAEGDADPRRGVPGIVGTIEIPLGRQAPVQPVVAGVRNELTVLSVGPPSPGAAAVPALLPAPAL